MSFDPHALKLYVDGNCWRNPGGNSGFAAWVEYPIEWNRPDERLEEVGFQKSTNNRMELQACLWAHQWVRAQYSVFVRVQRVQIITDSKYVYDNWRRADHWRSCGWRNSAGRKVENEDLWKEFLSIRGKLRIRVDIMWTHGKKSPILKAVDKPAKNAGKEPTEIDRGYRVGKVGRTKNKVEGAAALFPARGQRAMIRIYYSTALPGGENKFKFQLYSEAKGDFFEKFVAYAQPGIGAQLHRHHSYMVQFNSEPKYPIIVGVLQETTPP